MDILRISTIGYSAKQGIKNIWRNIMFSAASIATMTACIFLFGLFFSLLINFRYIVKNAEEGVAVTVLFDDGVDQATINSIGEQKGSRTITRWQTHPVILSMWTRSSIRMPW